MEIFEVAILGVFKTRNVGEGTNYDEPQPCARSPSLTRSDVALIADRTRLAFTEELVFRARAQPQAVLVLVIDERFRLRAPFH